MALTLNLADVQLPARGLQSIQLVPRGDCPTSRYVGLLLAYVEESTLLLRRARSQIWNISISRLPKT